MKTHIFDILAEIVKKASGIDMNRVDIASNYISLGFDSLVVVRIDQGIKKHFNLEIDMGLYYDEVDSLSKLIDYIADNLPSDWASANLAAPEPAEIPIPAPNMPVNIPVTAAPILSTPAISEKVGSDLEALLNAQMRAMSDLMHHQLDVLGAYSHTKTTSTYKFPSVSEKPQTVFSKELQPCQAVPQQSQSAPSDPLNPPKPKIAEIRAMKFDPDSLNSSQQKFLERFIPPYIEKTKKSKLYAQEHRTHLADWINTLGFRRSIKEIVYPIVSERSLGSRVWDIDGNEYIDIAMGYGVNLFGHSPSFVTKAIKDQVERGVELGPQNRFVGEVAKMISEMTGMDRVAFCNTGSEAVMMALRAAQAVSRKDRIALFMGSYHGNSDLVIKDTLLLRYGEESALNIIRENAHELAAVLVEPVQSRNPSLQPKEFLHALRALTTELGIVLIFDEMINGFRCHPGGAQAVFGVRADMATYGKVPAGGMPIGIVAGSKECMEVIDGGLWDYGDDSVPGQEVIFFGGTFCKHPFAMAAAHACLLHMKEKGPSLQEKVNLRTTNFANEINDFFEKENIHIKIAWFASQFIFQPTLPLYRQPVPPPDTTVWFHLLMSKGIYTWERRICFFSEAHTDEDVEKIIKAIKESSLELKAAGFPLFGGISPDTPEYLKDIKKKELTQEELSKKKTDSLGTKSTKAIKKTDEKAIEKNQANVITIPLTQAQQQLWFLAQLNENAIPAYIETVAVRLTGRLDRDALSGAASDLVARHSALRTVMVGDGKNQKILPSMPSNIDFTESTAIYISPAHITGGSVTPKSQEDSELIQIWLKDNSKTTFDLINGPLFSFKILTLDSENHVLAMNFHHIVMDGISVNVLLGDLMLSYSNRVKGAISETTGKIFDAKIAPDLRDYQSWLENYLSSAECARDEKFWKELFPNTIPMLDFPTDMPRPSLFTFKGARHHVSADPELLTKCFAFGRSRRLTPFMTMISLYTLWIHKLTGRDEVVIGFPVSGRFFEDSDALVGYCTHLVPFVSRYDATKSFGQYLDRSRETLTAAYRHQKYPFSQLIRNLQFEQDMSRGSVIASEFNLDQVQGMPALDGLTLSMINIPLSYAKYDFNVEIMEVNGQYQFKFEYATDLFKPETVSRFANHFMTLLGEVVDKPEEPLYKISLLSSVERHQIVNVWNNTYRDFPLQHPFHRLFEEQVSKTPDNIAAVFSALNESGEIYISQQMTYRELNSYSNRLARNLIKEINLSGTSKLSIHVPLIPILAERSCHFLVAMIGIFKAGCAYLPLDPEHPADRIGGILKQSGAKIILAEKKFQHLLESRDARPCVSTVLWFEDSICDSSLTPEDEQNLPYNIKADSPENLAYIIFTSGSTGLPKGAMVQQKGMVNHLYAKIEDLGIGTNDIVAQNASQCFDISVWQFLSALLKGGHVQIVSNDIAHDPSKLFEVSTKQKITILEVVPSFLRVLLEQIDSSFASNQNLNTLRWLVPTGEALPPILAAKWFEYYPNVPILNAYGPTECSDDVAHYAFYHAPAPDTAVIPIGRPVGNMCLYILDSHLEPVPVGVIGELWVGGVGVGLGYLNQKELTDKSFIPDPFNFGTSTQESFNSGMLNQQTNSRLYKTGDLAQFLPDGNILFLGRVDHQVKIRGFRIELGEIESVLAKHPKVKELVVTASSVSYSSNNQSADQTSNDDNMGLTAYIVFHEKIGNKEEGNNKDDDSQLIDEIRNYLADRLPNYMVPSYFVVMEKLPLTSNGKIDRKALPKPTITHVESLTPFTPPRNEVEQILVEVLSGVLNRESIGIHDNYFALGGDSIKAIQAVARVQAEGYILKLRDIFQYPTVAELAPHLTRRSRKIDQGTVTGFVHPTPIQSWLLNQDKALIHHYNQAVTINFKYNLKIDSLKAALESIMVHHDALRLTVQASSELNSGKLNSGGASQLRLNIKGTELKPELLVIPFDPQAKQRSSKAAYTADQIGDNSDHISNIDPLFKAVSQKLHSTMDIFNGPLLRAALFQGDTEDRLMVVIHHLAVDAISWQILVEDLLSAYNSHSNGQGIKLPAKTDSFKSWSESLENRANNAIKGNAIKSVDANKLNSEINEISYWESLVQEELVNLPTDFEPNNVLNQDSKLLNITLPAPDTAILVEKANLAYNTDMNDLLLTAIAKSLKHWAGINGVLVALEGHGRDWIEDEIDISRTVGWFTVEYPVLLKLPEIDKQLDFKNEKINNFRNELGLEIKHIKESLHKVPNHGANFGLISQKLSHEVRARLKPNISFNYLGVVDLERDGLSVEPASHIELANPKMEKPYTLEIESEIRKGRLNIQIYYAQNQYKEDTINRLGSIIKGNLIDIIDHCSSIKVSEVTPSDLTWSGFSLSQFETFLHDNKMTPSDIQDIYPLTPMQENMLFSRLYDSDSTAYFEQFSFTLKGDVNLKRFEDTWNIVSQRHDIIRTSFIYKGVPRPLQVVRRIRPIEWHYEDWSQIKDKEARLEAFKIEERQRGFLLDSDTLMRMNIFKLEPFRYAAVWSFHHILMDGWCLGILIEDVQSAYMALNRGQIPKFAGTAPQYREYILWLENADHAKAVGYWSNYLEGFNKVTSLPRDVKVDAVKVSESINKNLQTIETSIKDTDTSNSDLQKLYQFELEPEVSRVLNQIARDYQITINSLVQSVWSIMLAEANRVSDVAFGAAVAGRPAGILNVERMVGLFINTVPVRVKLADNISFKELVRVVQAESIDSEPHHFVSLASIQTACNVESSLLDHVL
ncbi:MAG: amino acid adenylation domain-containing protein, partial [Desulfamplus sp.]|nr:amino acid adenylation domain-containing protein [Desulfamplus sp.]